MSNRLNFKRNSKMFPKNFDFSRYFPNSIVFHTLKSYTVPLRVCQAKWAVMQSRPAILGLLLRLGVYAEAIFHYHWASKRTKTRIKIIKSRFHMFGKVSTTIYPIIVHIPILYGIISHQKKHFGEISWRHSASGSIISTNQVTNNYKTRFSTQFSQNIKQNLFCYLTFLLLSMAKCCRVHNMYRESINASKRIECLYVICHQSVKVCCHCLAHAIFLVTKNLTSHFALFTVGLTSKQQNTFAALDEHVWLKRYFRK